MLIWINAGFNRESNILQLAITFTQEVIMATKNLEKSGKKEVAEKSVPERLFPLGLASLNNLDRIFDEYFNRNWLHGIHPGFSRGEDLWGTYEMRPPKVDVIDRDNTVVIRAELPGVDKKDLDVTVSDNVLTIRGVSQQERKDEKEDYYSREIRSGSFCRSMTLPNNVDSGKIEANFKNGLLELSIPKTAKSSKTNIKVS